MSPRCPRTTGIPPLCRDAVDSWPGGPVDRGLGQASLRAQPQENCLLCAAPAGATMFGNVPRSPRRGEGRKDAPPGACSLRSPRPWQRSRRPPGGKSEGIDNAVNACPTRHQRCRPHRPSFGRNPRAESLAARCGDLHDWGGVQRYRACESTDPRTHNRRLSAAKQPTARPAPDLPPSARVIFFFAETATPGRWPGRRVLCERFCTA